MKKKLIGALIVVVGLIILAAIVYFMFFYDFSPKEPAGRNSKPIVPVSEQTQKPPESAPSSAVINVRQFQADNKNTENDLKRMAASFAERFGSYSNQSNYGNIRDLKVFMSSSMQDWADRYIQEEMIKDMDTGMYYGITTKAVSQKMKLFDEDLGKAKCLVGTQRIEAIGTTNNTTSFQQYIVIYFTKERGAWKVNRAEWQDR